MSEIDRIEEELKNQDEYYGTMVIDLLRCNCTTGYLRQELRRRGYSTKLSGKNSRWLMLYKKGGLR